MITKSVRLVLPIDLCDSTFINHVDVDITRNLTTMYTLHNQDSSSKRKPILHLNSFSDIGVRVIVGN